MSSPYTDMTNAAMEHLEQMAGLHPDLASEYNRFSDFFSRKLWHQLTVALLDFVCPSPATSAPTSSTKEEGGDATAGTTDASSSSSSSKPNTLRTTYEGGNSYLALYDRVVLACDSKINQLSLARIASAVATSLASSNVADDAVAAKAVLENLLEKRVRLGPPAALYVESKLALLQMMTSSSKPAAIGEPDEGSGSNEDKYEGVKAMLARGANLLQEMEGESATVHSAFYEASSAYRKIVGPPEAFYREALMYLNYTPVESMTTKERYTLATDLSLAALTGEGVFNFGEVVETPILSCLHNTNNAWLMELMHCFAQGNVEQFATLTAKGGTAATAMEAQPALVSRAALVQEKMTLLALVNMVFERPSAERTLQFEEIAERTKVEEKQVEWVVMRALSLGLIQGSMDQVDGTVSVSWVMPRVLNEGQLRDLAERFGEWSAKVGKARDYMGEQTNGLLA